MKWVLILGLIVSFNAQAWEMDRIGYSKGKNKATQRQDSNWRQSGDESLFFTRNDESNTWAIEVGGKTSWSWLRWSFEYADRGSTSLWGNFINDIEYFNKDYSGDHLAVYLQSATRSFVFTFDPKWRYKKVTFYAQLGLSYYHSTTRVCADLSTAKPTQNRCPVGWNAKFSDKGFSFYHAKGLEWHITEKHSAFIMRYDTKREYDTTSFNRNNKGYRAGYRFYF